MTAPAAQIDSYLLANFDTFIEETIELCAQPSISARGEGLRECADLVAKVLERHGFVVQQIETPGNPVIVATATGRSERTLLFYNHYDVQPPEPLDLWTTPPFQPTLRDGALFGRGTRDDKGEIVARLAAVEGVRAAHAGQLPCGITFVIEGEEEIGSPHIAQFVRDHVQLLKCHGAIWEEGGSDSEGRPYTNLGCRGLLYVELAVETLTLDAHSGGAHLLPNAAWRLLWALATLKGSDEHILIPGFYDEALPPTPLDATLMAAMPANAEAIKAQYGAKELVNQVTGTEINRAVFNPTGNIAGLMAGYQGEGIKTVIPAKASAKMDFRLVPWQNPDDIFTKLRSHLDAQGFADVDLKKVAAVWPYKAPADDPFVQLTARAGEEAYGLPYQLTPTAGGTTPVYAFANPLGNIPVVSAGVGYGFNNRSHAPDEHVRLDDFMKAARHIARIIEGFGRL